MKARLLLAAVAAFAGVGVAGVGVAGVAQAATATGDVFIVHGLAGQTADIVVDGRDVAASAPAETVVGPLHLSAGSHVVTFKSGTSTVVSARFTVTGGASSDVVAHRTADAAMTAVVTVFGNDTSPVAPGKTRVVVSHVAVAPPADIRVNGEPLFRNVANGESLSLVVPAQKVSVDVVPTATSGPPVLAPVSLTLQAGTLTRVFAIGNATDGTMDAIVQVQPIRVVGSTRPTKVQTGDGGQAADAFVTSGPGIMLWAAIAIAVTMLALLGAARGSAVGDRVIGSRVIGSRRRR